MKTKYTNEFKAWEEQFDPTDYGYTQEDLDDGNIDIYEEWVAANYGNSDTARYLRQNRGDIENA